MLESRLSETSSPSFEDTASSRILQEDRNRSNQTSPIAGVIDPALRESSSTKEATDAMQEASYLSLSAMAEPTDRQSDVSRGLSFLSLLSAAMKVNGTNPTLPEGRNPSLTGSLADFRSHFITEYDFLDKIDPSEPFQVFQNAVVQSYPFITEFELGAALAQIMDARKNGTFDQILNQDTGKVAIVYLGLAIGILLSSDYNYKELIANELIFKAVQLMTNVFDNATDLTMGQCLTALTIASLFTTHGGSTWHLLGLAMMRCISSGWHTARGPTFNSHDEDSRRKSRLLWSLYSLDTYISSSLDRPYCLNNEDILVSPPLSNTSSPNRSEDASHRCLVQHAQIIRNIRDDMDGEILSHFINLRHWKETLPGQVNYSPLQQSHLYNRGLIEILQQSRVILDPSCSMIAQHAEESFIAFLDVYEGSLIQRESAPSALDSLQIFFIGIWMALRLSTNTAMSDIEGAHERYLHAISWCMSILAQLSMRYPPVQSLRDILLELQLAHLSLGPPIQPDRLQRLVSESPISISAGFRNVIFVGFPSRVEQQPRIRS
ncbi:hypothetical protein BU24DRAFT_360439 [Aaosphaeria arxii CBS 175.79]|uniref:Xylanolytic transcriptional activator regulatory domain-containing protein n=1 Tax=Aaosphaeria arxii CBS 175.79 TaxID=1450172 RepID=A0A6A5X654_9PLEO|nr:uncharacterized protein BU24DRAFT_360439 [Aaosphaeria arxii CBS 175.79]KAF2008402.1 hypothetical protein BU24DRAFT_360439 [Aaosphaeria arxii CBS 175.79]